MRESELATNEDGQRSVVPSFWPKPVDRPTLHERTVGVSQTRKGTYSRRKQLKRRHLSSMSLLMGKPSHSNAAGHQLTSAVTRLLCSCLSPVSTLQRNGLKKNKKVTSNSN